MNPLQNQPSPADTIIDALQHLDIDNSHGPEALAETQELLLNTGLDDPTLDDLTELPFVTIDNPDSRDLDQALLIERSSNGYRVRYALADAAYYITPDSALFQEALIKGTTYYTPTMAAPMLPPELSEGLISLNPNVDRRALVFDMEVDLSGTASQTTIVRAKIRSQKKLSYVGVQAWLDSGVKPLNSYEESLHLLRELGNILIDSAAERGVVNFDRTETHIRVSGSPPFFEAAVRQRYNTERYNEQLSLLCNMQGAEMLLAFSGVTDALQAVYRVHQAPLHKSLKKLRETLSAFAEDQAEPEQWHWKKDQTLANFVENLPSLPHETRRVRTVQRHIMQAQRGSHFQPEPGEHHALKAASYARFSSPMREIVGIYTHKELLEALSGRAFDNDLDEELRERVIASANAAKSRQRQLDKAIEFAAMFSVFSRDLNAKTAVFHKGTLIGMRKDRLYINLDKLAFDVKIYKDNLETEFNTRYEMTNTRATPANSEQPTWMLGQAVTIAIKAYDKSRKRFLLQIVASNDPIN